MTPDAYAKLVEAFRLVFGVEPPAAPDWAQDMAREIESQQREQAAQREQIDTIQVAASEMVELILSGVNLIATTPAAQAIIRDRTERLFAAAVPSVHVGEQGSIVPCYRVSLNMWRYLADEYWRVPA